MEKHSEPSEDDVYQFLVVDSGPIIRLTGASTLWKKARQFYTVPAVLQEIRDAKARQHLEQLPFELKTAEPSREGILAVSEFARLTGDYASLSVVDLQVLALLHDLEREACHGNISHIRTTPKRTLGLGKVELLGGKHAAVVEAKDCIVDAGEGSEELLDDLEQVNGATDPTPAAAEENESTAYDDTKDTVKPTPKTWAALLTNNSSVVVSPEIVDDIPAQLLPSPTDTRVSFAQMTLGDEFVGGQFSDAESDDDADLHASGDSVSSSGSDEECESCVLDSEELEQDKPARKAWTAANVQQELQSDFPSLAASLAVPYDGSDDDDASEAVEDTEVEEAARKAAEEEQRRRSLQPISKSGKLYNSFKKYGDLMKTKPKNSTTLPEFNVPTPHLSTATRTSEENEDVFVDNNNQSRIMGGTNFAGQDDNVDDDGEGWITSTNDIRAIKAAGVLQPRSNPSKLDPAAASNKRRGPHASERAACTTTDFAMQNVILQMNLALLSVDGMKVRKLKNWVTRCGACFTVYTSSDNTGPLGKRLFCGRCGSDLMQRIAASVDGQTGRLRLHLSKNYKHNLRGTKFSLPKPGTGNRFHGDLLLREDQLLMGAWNQKVKMRSGGKAKSSAQSMFGRDIASNVGCHATAMTSDDIRVGFGRRNPNAAKGRERRGKKKKSTDKACGLRRY